MYGDGQLPWAAIRVQIAERMGWTLEYVDNLSADDLWAILGTWRGMEAQSLADVR